MTSILHSLGLDRTEILLLDSDLSNPGLELFSFLPCSVSPELWWGLAGSRLGRSVHHMVMNISSY